MHILESLTAAFFPQLRELGDFRTIKASELPGPYRKLLDHDEHMTVAIEAHHGCGVDVRVLSFRRMGDVYTRASLLERQSDGGVVQLGIMRIDMLRLSPKVQQEIEAEVAPMGRILIRHGVMRHLELEQLWQIIPGSVLRDRLSLADGEMVYGRSARIAVDGRPAVELLEIPKA